MRDDLKRILDEDEPQKGAAIERLRAAWARRKWLAVLVFAIPFVAGVTVTFSLPTLYRSTALVLVERQQVPEAFVKATVTSELETRLQTISQEILSRAQLEALIAQFGLYPRQRRAVASEEVLERMRRDIKLELKTTDTKNRPNATTAFALSYRGPDPYTVALVTNTLASLFVEGNLRVRERQATGTSDFLEAQLAQTREHLDELETRVSDFRRRHMGELPQQMQVNLATLENLNTQLRVASDNQIRAAERRDSLTALLAEAASYPQASGSVSESTRAADPRSVRIARLRQELAAARARYTEQHPSVTRLKAELAATEQEPADSPGGAKDPAAGLSNPYVMRLRETLSTTESEIKILKAEEQRLRAAIATYQTRLENTPKREQEFQELSRDYESTKQLYETLKKRHEEAQLAENMEQRQKGEQFRVLDPATPSQVPAAPNRLKLLAVSVFLALGLAGGALMLAEMLDTSFHSAAELRDFSKVPVLVSVPRIVTEADKQTRQRRFRMAAAGTLAGLILIAGASYVIGHGNQQLLQMLDRAGS